MCIYVCVLCVYLYVCVWLHICVYVCGCMCVYTLYIYISYTYYRPVIKPFLGARSKSVNASAWVHSLSLAAFLEKHGREVQIIFGTFLEADINTPSKGSYWWCRREGGEGRFEKWEWMASRAQRRGCLRKEKGQAFFQLVRLFPSQMTSFLCSQGHSSYGSRLNTPCWGQNCIPLIWVATSNGLSYVEALILSVLVFGDKALRKFLRLNKDIRVRSQSHRISGLTRRGEERKRKNSLSISRYWGKDMWGYR